MLYHFHRVEESAVVTGRRHPRGNKNWPEVGVFAQRVKSRPNQIGATICRLVSVAGRTIRVQGLDALDGSPVLDIKPVFAEFVPDHASIRQPAWSHELIGEVFCALMRMETLANGDERKSDVCRLGQCRFRGSHPLKTAKCSAASD